MRIECLDKLMCSLGYHDFKLVARWCAKDKAGVITEEHCTRCGEDAYELSMFSPKTCKGFNRCVVAQPLCVNSEEECLVVGVGRDRRISIEKKTKPAKNCGHKKLEVKADSKAKSKAG